MNDTQGQVSSVISPDQGADDTAPVSCSYNRGIPVTSEVSFGGPSGAPGKALPVLYELLSMAEALLASGQTDSLDLGRLPLTPSEIDAVRLALGHGEVDANIQALGLTRVRETAVPGLWWITHYNQAEQVIGECIEVTFLPEILSSDQGSLPSEIEGLRARIVGLASHARQQIGQGKQIKS